MQIYNPNLCHLLSSYFLPLKLKNPAFFQLFHFRGLKNLKQMEKWIKRLRNNCRWGPHRGESILITIPGVVPEDVAEGCTGALHVLARDPLNRSLIRQSNVIPTICGFLASTNENMQRSAAGLLCELAADKEAIDIIEAQVNPLQLSTVASISAKLWLIDAIIFIAIVLKVFNSDKKWNFQLRN